MVEGLGACEDKTDDVKAIVFTYGQGQESKAQQYSCITDKRKDPHVVFGDVAINANDVEKFGDAETTQKICRRSFPSFSPPLRSASNH